MTANSFTFYARGYIDWRETKKVTIILYLLRLIKLYLPKFFNIIIPTAADANSDSFRGFCGYPIGGGWQYAAIVLYKKYIIYIPIRGPVSIC